MTIPVQKQDTIRFKRFDSVNIIEYRVYATETLSDGTEERTLIETVKNTHVPSPIHYREIAESITATLWRIPHDAYYNDDYPINVYANGTLISNSDVSIDKAAGVFEINIARNITSNDFVEIDFYKDELEVIHSIQYSAKYSIVPVILYSHTVGDHNIIR